MIFKKFKPFESPRKVSFRDPDTGREFKGPTISDVANQIRGYRSQNELPPLDLLEIVIENHICNFPIHAGCCTPLKGPKRTFMHYVRGGVAFLKNVAYKDFADQVEADRRSEICVQCPHNIFPDRGGFVKWIEDLTNRSVGKRQSKHHNELGLCGICTCPLRSKVFFKGKITLTKEELRKMSELENPKCWQVPLAEAKTESNDHKG
jgi:hypothetical protein